MLLPSKSRKSRCLAIPALVILVTVCLFPVPGFSGTYKIYPTADAGVVQWVPDGPFGTDTSVYVVQIGFSPDLIYSYAYFKFDLSSIPKGQTITGGASLYAYCNYVDGFPASCELRAVPDTSWIESDPGGITWNNKPAYESIVIATVKGFQDTWTHWDIPAANLPATGLVSFVLTPAYGPASPYYSYFNSRENSSNKPYLQVNTVGPDLAPIISPLLMSE
jgi:hypothetical protein